MKAYEISGGGEKVSNQSTGSICNWWCAMVSFENKEKISFEKLYILYWCNILLVSKPWLWLCSSSAGMLVVNCLAIHFPVFIGIINTKKFNNNNMVKNFCGNSIVLLWRNFYYFNHIFIAFFINIFLSKIVQVWWFFSSCLLWKIFVNVLWIFFVNHEYSFIWLHNCISISLIIKMMII